MKKIRNYVTPSSLGSYFGVGFNSPEEQIAIDLGQEEAYFDDAAKARMTLGNMLEDATLNYFEHALGVIINERNDQLRTFYDNKMKGKIDGMTIYNGLPTVVENKISNSKTYKFTENMGYVFQVQSYMMATDTEQAIICGLYQGQPIYKVIQKNEEMIQDIKTMVDFVYDMLMGFESWDNFPYHLTEKYSGVKALDNLENVNNEDEELFNELADLKAEKASIEQEINYIEEKIKNKFESGKYENDRIKLTISEAVRRGGLDTDRLSIEHPEINYDNYIKPSTTYKTLRVNIKK